VSIFRLFLKCLLKIEKPHVENWQSAWFPTGCIDIENHEATRSNLHIVRCFVLVLKVHHGLLISAAPSLGVYYFLSLTLSVCPAVPVRLSVTNIASSFLFLDGIEPFLGHQFYMTKTTKLFSSIFDLGPLNPKVYSPKFA